MAGDEMGRARLSETMLRRDKRRPLEDPETELPFMRRRIEASASSSSAASGPLPAVPTASVVIPSASSQSPEVFEDKEMAADMDVDRADWTSFERQVGELGMLMTALGQTETRVAEFLEPGRFTVRARRFDLRPDVALDLRTGYFFSKEADRLRARECLRKKENIVTRCIFTWHIIVATADCGKRLQAMEGNGK